MEGAKPLTPSEAPRIGHEPTVLALSRTFCLSGCPPSAGIAFYYRTAFMLASKIICDDTYSNKSWCIMGHGMFALQEINQMEWVRSSYLGRGDALSQFGAREDHGHERE